MKCNCDSVEHICWKLETNNQLYVIQCGWTDVLSLFNLFPLTKVRSHWNPYNINDSTEYERYALPFDHLSSKMRKQEKSMFTGIPLEFLWRQRKSPIRRISFCDFWHTFQQKTLHTCMQRHRIITYHSNFRVRNTARFLTTTTRLADDILLLTNGPEVCRESPNFSDTTE